MSLDFTLGTYRDLLAVSKECGYDVCPVREYLARTGTEDREVSSPFLVLRHDVDRKPQRALAMARVEAEYGVESTYYVRTIEKTFKPDLIRCIASLGHEVGYHYEDMDRADGDPDAAHASFERELGRLRRIVDVDTVCMHGNPLSPHVNHEMWETGPDPADYDLLGEAFLDIDYDDVCYYSDTGRTWRNSGRIIDAVNARGNGPGDMTRTEAQRGTVDSTSDLVERLRSERCRRVCLLVHPERWAGSYPEWIAASVKDSAINAAKIGVNIITRG